jgi:hypothetical protein
MPHPATRCDSRFAACRSAPAASPPRPLRRPGRSPRSPATTLSRRLSRPGHLAARLPRPGRPRLPLCPAGFAGFHPGCGTELRRGGKGSRWRVPMPGMKITLNAAMRARDVSRPRPENEAAAELSNASGASRSGLPRPEPSRAAPPRAPEASLPTRPAAPRAAAPSPATSQSTTPPATPSGRTAAAAPAAAGKAKSPGTPKAPGQNGDAGRGRSGGRGKRHRSRRRGGR